MNAHNTDQTIFVTVVRTLYGKTCARLLIESLRTFGGAMRHCLFWLFEVDPQVTACRDLEDLGVKVWPLETPEAIQDYLFGNKVYACAQAEALAPSNARSLVIIDPNCLIVQPPLLYALDGNCDAAFRPVHIRNVGSLADQPLDAFWQNIYETVGVKDISMTIESFIDGQRLRAYFNSHAFTINPTIGIMKRWLACFETLVSDQSFQSGACQDEKHQIFLFQAILSAVVVSELGADRLRLLPPVYNYPYHFQESIPDERRANAFNDLVSIAYEDFSIHPRDVKFILVHEPLLGWLLKHGDNLPQGY
ncbi:MAG: hypothetical protein JW908_11170 [Anaerolineales bacterium]|nr:hypothetical protein [Anaerolineales bacterium]